MTRSEFKKVFISGAFVALMVGIIIGAVLL